MSIASSLSPIKANIIRVIQRPSTSIGQLNNNVDQVISTTANTPILFQTQTIGTNNMALTPNGIRMVRGGAYRLELNCFINSLTAGQFLIDINVNGVRVARNASSNASTGIFSIYTDTIATCLEGSIVTASVTFPTAASGSIVGVAPLSAYLRAELIR
jgi:hypothetical protein